MNAERYTTLSKALQQILHKLTTEYQPDKIILFGSMATGNVSEWSDIDLVIIKDTPKRFIDRLKEVALLCRETHVGVNYLVYTPDELNQMIARHHPFVVGEILDKGKVLYERQPRAAVA